MEAARKQQEIVGFWPIPDMAQEMRVEHDRLTQLGWVYDGFGGYRKKAASSHPGPHHHSIAQRYRDAPNDYLNKLNSGDCMEVARIMRVAGYYNGDAMAYGRGMTAFKRSIDNLMGAI